MSYVLLVDSHKIMSCMRTSCHHLLNKFGDAVGCHHIDTKYGEAYLKFEKHAIWRSWSEVQLLKVLTVDGADLFKGRTIASALHNSKLFNVCLSIICLP